MIIKNIFLKQSQHHSCHPSVKGSERQKTIQKKLSKERSDRDVASQRGVSISHLKKILKLLKLPSAKRKLIENDDPAIHSLSFNQALAEVHKHE